jgi:hypothetical protein
VAQVGAAQVAPAKWGRGARLASVRLAPIMLAPLRLALQKFGLSFVVSVLNFISSSGVGIHTDWWGEHDSIISSRALTSTGLAQRNTAKSTFGREWLVIARRPKCGEPNRRSPFEPSYHS